MSQQAYISDRKFWFPCVAKLQKADRSNLANAHAGKWKLHNLLKGKIMEELML